MSPSRKRKQSGFGDDFELNSVAGGILQTRSVSTDAFDDQPKKRHRTTGTDSKGVDNDSNKINPASRFRPFEFLKLPPEIRNQIYDNIISDVQQQQPGSKDHITQRPEAATNKTGKSTIFKGYYCLKQTCTQLRSEFGPLINPLDRTIVRFPVITAYLDDCHRSSDPSLPNQ